MDESIKKRIEEVNKQLEKEEYEAVHGKEYSENELLKLRIQKLEGKVKWLSIEMTVIFIYFFLTNIL